MLTWWYRYILHCSAGGGKACCRVLDGFDESYHSRPPLIWQGTIRLGTYPEWLCWIPSTISRPTALSAILWGPKCVCHLYPREKPRTTVSILVLSFKRGCPVRKKHLFDAKAATTAATRIISTVITVLRQNETITTTGTTKTTAVTTKTTTQHASIRSQSPPSFHKLWFSASNAVSFQSYVTLYPSSTRQTPTRR